MFVPVLPGLSQPKSKPAHPEQTPARSFEVCAELLDPMRNHFPTLEPATCAPHSTELGPSMKISTATGPCNVADTLAPPLQVFSSSCLPPRFLGGSIRSTELPVLPHNHPYVRRQWNPNLPCSAKMIPNRLSFIPRWSHPTLGALIPVVSLPSRFDSPVFMFVPGYTGYEVPSCDRPVTPPHGAPVVYCGRGVRLSRYPPHSNPLRLCNMVVERTWSVGSLLAHQAPSFTC